jgi:hypothetical protein
LIGTTELKPLAVNPQGKLATNTTCEVLGLLIAGVLAAVVEEVTADTWDEAVLATFAEQIITA